MFFKVEKEKLDHDVSLFIPNIQTWKLHPAEQGVDAVFDEYVHYLTEVHTNKFKNIKSLLSHGSLIIQIFWDLLSLEIWRC